MWATGGLETTFFALLALAGFARLTAKQTTRNALVGGTLLALACLTRPDGVLFALVGVASPLALGRGDPWRAVRARTLSALAPLVSIVGAFVAFKLLYYGRLFPDGVLRQVRGGPLLLARASLRSPLRKKALGPSGPRLRSCRLFVLATRNGRALLARRDALLSLGAAMLFAAYVAHSGGDYMFARRLVPCLPFAFVFLDAGRRGASTLGPAIAAGGAIALASFFPHPRCSSKAAPPT